MMDLQEKYKQLTAPFPQEAYMTDESRGFLLIGIGGAFVVERLNEVFDMLGYGWRFVHSSFEERQIRTGQQDRYESIVEVAIQYRFSEALDGGGCYPVNWTNEGWAYDNSREPIWSEPIFGTGGSRVGGGSVPLSDARKGALTGALSKAASRLGVGILAYKGQLEKDGQTVVVKGEQSVVKQFEEATALIGDLLKVMSRIAPDEFQALRVYPMVERYFVDGILTPLGEYIKGHNLTGFITDHHRELLHNEGLESFEQMTMREAAFLAELVVAIVQTEGFGWKDAQEVAKTWDRQKTWKKIYDEWLALTTKTVEE